MSVMAQTRVITDARRRGKARYNKAYSLKNYLHLTEYQREYYARNGDRKRKAARERYVKNREREVARSQKRRAENGEAIAVRDRQRHREKRESAAERPCPAVCEICGEPPKPGKVLEFEHDHIFLGFRGWACHRCNHILGRVNDDPKVLDALAAYLRSHGYE